MGRTRYMITSLTAHLTRIAVGDCRDGILLYSYHEVSGAGCLYCIYFSNKKLKEKEDVLFVFCFNY